MARSRLSVWLGCLVAFGGVPVLAASAAGPDQAFRTVMHVAAPFSLAILDRSWNRDPHAPPVGRAVLEAQGIEIWELARVTDASTSADGSTVALLTSDHQVYVSRLPEPPRRIDGGPYLRPALSPDGSLLVAQSLGNGTHILEKTRNTRGIALVDLTSGEERLIVEGNDLYSPSFASDRMLFFGSGGEEQIASLYLLELGSMKVARVTNRDRGARQAFPSDWPRLAGGAVVYRADGEPFRVAAPSAGDFAPVHRFDGPKLEADEDISPDFGLVKIRRPITQLNQKPPILQYYDVDRRPVFKKDWYCAGMTYDQHIGTDFNQQYGFDVLAPASGRVIHSYDGCADTNSPGCGYGFGNFAAVRHSDRSVSLEAHGKKWTVAERGALVGCGQRLMQSAKSGNANIFHVHHESWVNPDGWIDLSLRYDPFFGSCDPNDPSKWSAQNGYRKLPGPNCTD